MAGKEKRIGLIVGREWSFPPALIKEVNGRNEGVTAELVQLGVFAVEAGLTALRGSVRGCEINTLLSIAKLGLRKLPLHNFRVGYSLYVKFYV